MALDIDPTVYEIGKFRNVENAYVEMAGMFDKFAQIQPSRNGETKEMHPFFYTIEDFSQYMLAVKGRVINFPFALAEILWIMLGEDDVWIANYNKQMGEYADDGIFNAAYGHRMRSNFYSWDHIDAPIDQFEDTINFLKDNHDSRHAVIVYRDPVKDRSDKQTKDRACNISSMFLIRNGMLNLTQTVRSHDFVWGVPYNFMQFGYITQALAERLGVSVGFYAELNNSLHVYDKHYDELKGIRYNNELSYTFDMTIPKIGDANYGVIKEYEEHIRTVEITEGYIKELCQSIGRKFRDSPFWRNTLLVLISYKLKNNKKQSLMVMNYMRSDLFRLMLLRYFYHYSRSWKKMLDAKDSLVNEYMKYSWLWQYEEVIAWLK